MGEKALGESISGKSGERCESWDEEETEVMGVLMVEGGGARENADEVAEGC